MSLSIDDILHDSQIPKIEPFISLRDKKKKRWTKEERLKWLETTFNSTWENDRARTNKLITSLAHIRGIAWLNQDPYGDYRTEDFHYDNDSSKITANDPYRYVDTLLGRLEESRSTVVPVPATNEFSDKQITRVGKKLLESWRLTQDEDAFLKRVTLFTLGFGETITFHLWNPDNGSSSPRYTQAKKEYKDEKHEFKDWNYDPDKPEHIGDIEDILPLPWEVLLDPNGCTPKDKEWVILLDFPHKEKLKIEYPKHADEIDGLPTNPNLEVIDSNTLQSRNLIDCLSRYRFWHRSSKVLPKGYYMAVVPSLMLDEGDNPLSDLDVLQASEFGDLPIERMIDCEMPGQFHGVGTLHLCMNLIHMKNKLLTMWNRNIQLYGMPKIMVHKQSGVVMSDLKADSFMIQWQGVNKPELVNWSTMTNDQVGFYRIICEEADKLMRIHPISQGTPPPGMTAGVALRLMESLEDRQLSNLNKRQNSYVLSRIRKRLALAGQNYKIEDGRMVWFVGKDQQDMIEELDITSLSRPFNLRLEFTSNLARSPAARTQQVIDLLAVAQEPEVREKAIDALELFSPEKITDPAQAAVANAEKIVELIANGEEVPPPRPGENYFVAWTVLMAFHQRPGFVHLPEKCQEEFEKYMVGLEYLMSEQAQKNPAFAQKLLTFPQWPAFFNLSEGFNLFILSQPPPPPPPPQPAPPPQPDPQIEQAKAAQEAELEQAKAASDAKIAQDKAMADAQFKQAELELKKQVAAAEEKLKRDTMLEEIAIKREEMELRMAIEKIKAENTAKENQKEKDSSDGGNKTIRIVRDEKGEIERGIVSEGA